ncbi:hypothetical protein BURMUCGD1_4430 [Burkholderia multivorans CGD1]|nr:hypothetical protein BURMUCGD1_4430 [Burkholderia multivorans CGD1]
MRYIQSPIAQSNLLMIIVVDDMNLRSDRLDAPAARVA